MTLLVQSNRAFFTADTHFFHHAMVERRGFKTKEEMNEALIENWNRVISHKDTVFHLGDLSFGNTVDTFSVINQLNGQIVLVRGNHDKKLKTNIAKRFTSIHDLLEIDIQESLCTKQRITLCHFAMRVWNRHHYRAWQLYGHSHGNLEPVGLQMDVGIDTHPNLAPFPYITVLSHMMNKKISIVDHHRPKELTLEGRIATENLQPEGKH